MTGRKSAPRRRVRGVLGVVAVLLVLATSWLAWRGLTVVRQLEAARTELGSLQFDLQEAAGSPDRMLPAARTEGSTQRGVAGRGVAGSSLAGSSVADSTAGELSARSLEQRVASVGRHTASARAAADDPLWRLAAHLPYAGSNLAALRQVTAAVDTVARQALPGLAGSAAEISAVRRTPLARGLPLPALDRVGGSTAHASDVLRAAAAALAASPRTGLFGPVLAARTQVLRELSRAQAALRPMADATAMAGPLLGGSGRRTYFVGFVNPAEARGGGGLLGGFAIVTADRGALTVSRIGSDADLPDLRRSPRGLPDDLVTDYAAYGATTDWDESNLSAHFPDTGQLWAAMYASVSGTRIDGVLSLDPSALAVLLRGAPPIAVAGGSRITSANVVSFLQRDEYALPLPAAERKGVLRSVARVAVGRLTAQPGSALLATLPALVAAADGGHIRFWSASAGQQAVLSRYAVAGQVPSGAGPFLSVVINNAASGKLDSYLAVAATYAVRTCPVPGPGARRVVDVTVTLDNTAPVGGLPAYVTVRGDGSRDGNGRAPPLGANRSLVQVLLTRGARVTASTLDGEPLGAEFGSDSPALTETTQQGHPVESVFAGEDPGARSTLVLRVDEPASARPPVLVAQPMAVPQELHAATPC